MKYTVSAAAYWTIVLHAAKYPHLSVDGLLIGKKLENGTVSITDAIPLFHGAVLAPMLEIATIQTDEYAKQKGLTIVGCYRANELVDDMSVKPVQGRIASKIHSHFPSACLLLVDNSQLFIGHKKLAVKLHTRGGSADDWKVRADELSLDEQSGTCFQMLADFMNGKRYQRLVDFDNHLEDPTRDWLNPDLFS